MHLRFITILTSLFVFGALAVSVSAQTASRKSNKRPVEKTSSTDARTDESGTEVRTEMRNDGKKNARPGDFAASNDKKNAPVAPQTVRHPVYVYEFSQPQFVYSNIRLEHDETGKGKITFRKKDLDEEFTDPVQLSPATLEKLENLWNALNFLDSTEDYQMPDRDYSHLGTMKIEMNRDGRRRAAEFNWTTNKDAKALVDEYRKIGNQYLWMFDIAVARENMPLEAPRVMKALEMFLKRGEISDPQQMIPLLQELSDDERIPLIARNNAARLIKEIEKKKK